MLLLTETAAGYALLKAKDSKVKNVDQLFKEDGIASLFKVKAFSKFDSAASALDEVNSIIEGKVSSKLTELLSELKEDSKTNLLVADPKLGNAINKLPGISFNITSDSKTAELFRAVREHLPELLPGLSDRDLTTMSLGLAHSLGRYKLKFSPDKVDTMIVHAIGLLDDLDKELNTYSMRLKEWYGWHFPEMAKIVSDNVAYARVVKALGYRTNAATTDLAEILPEDIEQQLRATAEISMGTEITASDLEHINSLADQIIELAAYREQLYSYLTNRMSAIAPNLTVLVGELVGARLIAHSGSMTSLAKAPASTIQILGAEKALFRALKTKKDTPKYGLIYNASLVGQASGRNKGKIARMLAAKCSLGLRFDAFTEERDDSPSVGLEGRTKVETRLGLLEGRDIAITRPVVGARKQQKVEVSAAPAYNDSADAIMIDATSSPAKLEDGVSKEEQKRIKKEKKAAEKAAKKDKKRKREADSDDESEAEADEVDVSTTIKSSPLKENGKIKKKDKKEKKDKHRDKKDKKDKKKKKTSE